MPPELHHIRGTGEPVFTDPDVLGRASSDSETMGVSGGECRPDGDDSVRARHNPPVAEDDFSFDDWPWAEAALASQGLDRLTAAERDAISAYAYNGYLHINDALWERIPMTAALERRIVLIRSGLAKYPLPQTVRVTREADAAVYGLTDEASAAALIDAEFAHDGFLSTTGASVPPRSRRHHDPVILDLLVPAGTPALRLGELSPIPREKELLVIDSCHYVVYGVSWDRARMIWVIQAVVM